mmetsp:Transcript_8676/g.18074  ORF Transcript_8676/g.18074 Transcript_8676/m.18074 type:complete len:127 (-) Transcript_8676:95-475(-)
MARWRIVVSLFGSLAESVLDAFDSAGFGMQGPRGEVEVGLADFHGVFDVEARCEEGAFEEAGGFDVVVVEGVGEFEVGGEAGGVLGEGGGWEVEEEEGECREAGCGCGRGDEASPAGRWLGGSHRC